MMRIIRILISTGKSSFYELFFFHTGLEQLPESGRWILDTALLTVGALLAAKASQGFGKIQRHESPHGLPDTFDVA